MLEFLKFTKDLATQIEVARGNQDESVAPFDSVKAIRARVKELGDQYGDEIEDALAVAILDAGLGDLDDYLDTADTAFDVAYQLLPTLIANLL